MVDRVSVGDDGRVARRHPADDRRMPRLRPHRTRRAAGRRVGRGRRATPTSTLSVMTPEQRAALTERLRGGRAARGNPFGPGSLTRVHRGHERQGRGRQVDDHREPRGGARGARARRSASSTPTCTGSRSPACSASSTQRRHRRAADPGRRDDPAAGRARREGDLDRHVRRADRARRARVIRRRRLARPDAAPHAHQFLTDVYFGDLDVLLVDLPPGTGDVAISLGQLLPNAEVVVVTTPQPAAADVAERSGVVARQTGQRIVGVIENMAGLAQPGRRRARAVRRGRRRAGRRAPLRAVSPQPVPLLASVPLSIALRQGGDAGDAGRRRRARRSRRARDRGGRRHDSRPFPASLGGRRLDVSVR